MFFFAKQKVILNPDNLLFTQGVGKSQSERYEEWINEGLNSKNILGMIGFLLTFLGLIINFISNYLFNNNINNLISELENLKKLKLVLFIGILLIIIFIISLIYKNLNKIIDFINKYLLFNTKIGKKIYSIYYKDFSIDMSTKRINKISKYIKDEYKTFKENKEKITLFHYLQRKNEIQVYLKVTRNFNYALTIGISLILFELLFRSNGFMSITIIIGILIIIYFPFIFRSKKLILLKHLLEIEKEEINETINMLKE